jgi:GNAT superfamily N-acetyltransferase
VERARALTPGTRQTPTSPSERFRLGYTLTCERGRVDLTQVHAWLSQEAYWAMGRERDVVERSIAGSLPYSVFADGRQVAFARVVTDSVTFAWICDVFVDKHHRSLGLGSWLVESIVADLGVLDVRRLVLVTRDAHEVYRRLGFKALGGPDRWMEIDLGPAVS